MPTKRSARPDGDVQPPSGISVAAPAIVTLTAVTRVTNSDGIGARIRLVARSRIAQRVTEISTNRENWLNPSPPGRTMTRTPMKPAAIASQRRQPTGSPKIRAAPSVMASGST